MVEEELECFVVELNVGNFGDDFLEETLSPGLRGVGHHRQGRVIIFLVLVIKEDQLRPEVGLLCSSQHLYTGQRLAICNRAQFLS